jgi:predicted alpha/beta hydrolase family esterase
MKLEFSQHILEKRSNFMKIHSEGDKLFRADRQTYIHNKANSLFCAIVRTHLNTPFELTHFPSRVWLLRSSLYEVHYRPQHFIKQK